MRVIFLILLLSASTMLFAQSSGFNNALKFKIQEGSNDYDVLVQGNIPNILSKQREHTYRVNYYAGNIASIHCNLTILALLLDKKIILRAEFIQPHVRALNDTMLKRNRIKPVKQGAAPLAQAYDGSGIILGFIDTGIDFNHGDFKDANGKSRIRFLWDQVPTAGSTVPVPFNYGIEWTETQINANQCTHSDLPFYGHGTHVAGIAAGTASANNTHEGCASKADIILVALDFNKSGPITADAVQYILIKATLLGKPCVINASVGDYYGSHDATDLEAQLIANQITNVAGRVMVAAAGNAGNKKYHVKTQPLANDTNFTWISNNTNTLEYWCYGDTLQVKNLQFSVGANRANYSDLGRIGFKNYNYALSSIKTDTLKHNGNHIAIIKTSASINASGVYELYFLITADTLGLKWRIETKGSGLHHAWNFDFVSNGLPTATQFPNINHYLKADTFYTMVSSYQCSDEIITVANYVNLNSYYDVHDTLRNTGITVGKIALSSSSGPTRDRRQKPDIAATGESVFSCIPLAMMASQIANSPLTVAQGSLHILGGGTSASSPVLAGLAALYLQKNPTATNRQVKEAITKCAYSDVFTGTTLPNYQWGYGKLDGKAAMLCGENLVNISVNKNNEGLKYFPNPFDDKVRLNFDKEMNGNIKVFSSEGKLVFEDVIHSNTYELHADKMDGNLKGLLLISISDKEGAYAFKLIKD